jgi:hypothetical protein
MSMLKKILIGLAIIIAIPFLVALFVQQKYAVKREIVIEKPLTEVFEYVKYLKNQDSFSKWANMDSEMKKSYRGEDGTVGFISAWESENPDVGAGEQEITGIVNGERIDYELRFLKPFEATEKAFMITEPVNENQTKIIWGFSGKMEYPMNLMLLFMDFEAMIGSDFQEGLEKLKIILESENPTQ